MPVVRLSRKVIRRALLTLRLHRCEGTGYVDLSTGAYNKLGTVDEGWVRRSFVPRSLFARRSLSTRQQFEMSWQFID